MSGPGRPALLSSNPIYREVWVAPIGWNGTDLPLGSDAPYPHKLEWVREDETGWHGWVEWLWFDEVPEMTWLKNYWKEVSCPLNS